MPKNYDSEKEKLIQVLREWPGLNQSTDYLSLVEEVIQLELEKAQQEIGRLRTAQQADEEQNKNESELRRKQSIVDDGERIVKQASEVSSQISEEKNKIQNKIATLSGDLNAIGFAKIFKETEYLHENLIALGVNFKDERLKEKEKPMARRLLSFMKRQGNSFYKSQRVEVLKQLINDRIEALEDEKSSIKTPVNYQEKVKNLSLDLKNFERESLTPLKKAVPLLRRGSSPRIIRDREKNEESLKELRKYQEFLSRCLGVQGEREILAGELKEEQDLRFGLRRWSVESQELLQKPISKEEIPVSSATFKHRASLENPLLPPQDQCGNFRFPSVIENQMPVAVQDVVTKIKRLSESLALPRPFRIKKRREKKAEVLNNLIQRIELKYQNTSLSPDNKSCADLVENWEKEIDSDSSVSNRRWIKRRHDCFHLLARPFSFFLCKKTTAEKYVNQLKKVC